MILLFARVDLERRDDGRRRADPVRTRRPADRKRRLLFAPRCCSRFEATSALSLASRKYTFIVDRLAAELSEPDAGEPPRGRKSTAWGGGGGWTRCTLRKERAAGLHFVAGERQKKSQVHSAGASNGSERG